MQLPADDPSADYWMRYSQSLPSLGDAWISACKKSARRVVLLDTLGTRLNGYKALTGSLVLARHVARHSPEQNIGILLPNSAPSVLLNMACLLLGKTVVNLNFSATPSAILSSLRQAEITTIYTSARFLERLQARGVDVELIRAHGKLIMLEDLRDATSTLSRLQLLLASVLLPVRTLQQRFCKQHDAEQTAAILFSSGSEGQPKGVLLSHRSLHANVRQTAQLLRFTNEDKVLANLPPFHAFGLTASYLLPLLEGVPILCHPDPTDVMASAQAIAKHGITILFGTSSFLRLYARNPKIRPEQLASLRLVVAGAEKLQDEVRDDFKARFDKDIFEGYGATETAPVASCNLPEDRRPTWLDNAVISRKGSVGLPLPGTRFRIVDPDSFAPLPTGTAGMVLISGPQLMQGYLDDHALTEHVIRSLDGSRWYISGDKGYLDEDGFLFIQDRYSRFAKIGGEMVGLGAVERALKDCLANPELDLLVVSLPCKRKGEKLVVLCSEPLDLTALREQLLGCGLNNLVLPSEAWHVKEIPRLGSGKTDFAAARLLAAGLCEIPL